MAPIENKRVHAEEEEEDAKRAKLAEESSDEDEEDDEVDEEDDSDDDFLANFQGYSADDFEGVEVTEEQVEKFNEAFIEFMNKLAQGGEEEPLIIGRALEIRPVPTTVEEFEEKLDYVMLPTECSMLKEELEEVFNSGNEIDEEDMPEDEDEEAISKKLEEAMFKNIPDIIDFVAGKIAEMTVSMEKKEFANIFLRLLVLTETVFDPQSHIIFYSEEHAEKANTDLVQKLAAAWKQLLAESDEVLSVTADLRAKVVKFLTTAADELKRGLFCGEDGPKDFYAKVSFDFQ